ncbi:hypothetical protein PG997_008788 [Apiospora hydei]|uniref:Uncharacterized protein n=1 Tax=Apiospora hydei TaxID=1337664 RepID=A0ABR1WBU3_9PEZI
MDTASITSRCIGNFPIPRDDHGESQKAIDRLVWAEHLRRKLNEEIHQSPDEVSAEQQADREAQMRLLIAMLQCPDVEPGLISKMAFFNRYEDGEQDFVETNEFAAKFLKDVVELWGRAQVHGQEGILSSKDFQIAIEYIFPGAMVVRVEDEILSDPERRWMNTLRLGMGINKEWDQFQWVIRPMPLSEDEVDDGTKLKIQFLYLNMDEDPLHAKSIYHMRKAVPDDKDIGRHIDWQRTTDDDTAISSLRLCTGDVYVLETKDPVNFPLPSRDLLWLQYCLDRFRHALKAKGALESLFRHPPPHVDPDAAQSGRPLQEPNGFWEGVVKDAVEAKALSEDDGHTWILGLGEWEEEKRRKKEEEKERRRQLELRLSAYEESEEDT